MEQFDDILGRVLSACEGLDETQIEAVLKRLMEEEGFDTSEKDFVEETFNLLDDSAKQYADLQKAKKNGVGRQEWMTKKFDDMLSDRSEEEVNIVMTAVEKATSAKVEKELEAAENDMDSTEK